MSVVRPRARRFTRLPFLGALSLVLLAAGLSVAPDVMDAGDRGNDRVALTSAVAGGLRHVAAGGEHSCGIRSQRLYCWGRNTWGQVGNGGRGARVAEPYEVARPGWRQVATGGASSCGIRGNRRLMYCWGLNHRGQLGDWTRKWRPSPVRVYGQWQTVDVGWSHTCGITKNTHRLRCWGDNSHGQLGRGNKRQSLTRSRIPGQWRQVAVEGWTTCGIKMDRSMWCWGRNILGQVGDGTTTDRTRPVRIYGPNWVSVDVSWTHACGVRWNGSVRCWGNNDRGQIGDGTTYRRLRPAPVAARFNARKVSTSEGGTCITTRYRVLWCWGDDKYQQVGGRANYYRRPQRMRGLYRTVTSGWLHHCAVRAGYNGVDCWGNNERAQTTPTTSRPVSRPAARTATTSNRAGSARAAPLNRAADPLVFTMASYNVLGENHTGPYRHDDRFAPSRMRAEWNAQVFRTHGLDIIGLQEQTEGQLQAIIKAGHGQYAAFPHPVSDNWKVESSILWDRSKFQVLARRVIRTLFINREYPRPYIKFRHRASGREFWVMNVHNAPWDYRRKRDIATREQIAKIKQLEATGDPVFYIGDFNEKRHINCRVLRHTDLRSMIGGWVDRYGRCHDPKQRMRVDWLFGSPTTEWRNFHFSKAPVIRLTTDHWVPMSVVRVP